MKKALILVVAVSVMLALGACGKKDDSAASTSTSSTAAATNAQEVQLKASAKTFTFDQPEYHVKKGQPVKFTLVNLDGTHGVEIKELNVKLEGSKLSQTVTPDKAGTYDIVCAVPCGSGHLNMKSKLVVE